MQTLTVAFYSDPGHGWIAVKRKLLKSLNIADKISHCSYQRGNTVYLEEDSDANLFIETMERQGIAVIADFKHTDKRSPIRSYQSYYVI